MGKICPEWPQYTRFGKVRQGQQKDEEEEEEDSLNLGDALLMSVVLNGLCPHGRQFVFQRENTTVEEISRS